MRDDLATLEGSLLSEVLEHAIFNGGKRVRPLLTVLAARLAGGPAIKDREAEIYRLAMVFEYLHAASLLHDDVIDRAEQRRGQDTANRIWGNTPVILAGDYLHARAMLLAGEIGGVECLELVGRATANMVEAEFLQMKNAEERDGSAERYFAVLQGKTAALIIAACEVGVIIAGGDAIQQAALRLYGTNLGLAFQVVDDLLDYLGDPGKTGKVVGNDFVEGKITLPLIHALEKVDSKDRIRCLALLEKTPEERAAGIPWIQSMIKGSGGFESARKQAEEMIAQATAALHIFADSPEKNILVGLAGYVLTREK
ncbi:MAG: polyprenyl synthetase family protein [Proteobacteria bacterium]|nr:polyprenyl synthetase family protein [Pseudomonadota bacterium]MBU1708486.1 polyprenyl synthetase family protein [Pseudomonadota bacterium]